MAKELAELYWVEELLPTDCTRKNMFGGFSYYVDEKIVLVLFEGSGSRTYRGKDYPFEIWNGCMFPAEKEHHSALLQQFPFLISHPVLPKWLYLPLETEDFESHVQKIMTELRRKNPLLGSVPKSKVRGERKSNRSKSSAQKKFSDEKIDTRRPRMFSDESSEAVFEKAKKISDLKNLGPEAEKAFAKAGIRTPEQMQKLGWQQVMRKLCASNPKNNHSIMAYAVIGALENKVWNLIPESEKSAARDFMKSLRTKAAKKVTKKKTKIPSAKKVAKKRD